MWERGTGANRLELPALCCVALRCATRVHGSLMNRRTCDHGFAETFGPCVKASAAEAWQGSAAFSTRRYRFSFRIHVRRPECNKLQP